jgi:hypothetical protein
LLKLKTITKMKTQFTKVEMYNLKGCYSKKTLDKCSFMVKDNISIIEILDSEIPLKDKSWFIRNSIGLTNLEKSQFAIGCALVVLPIYEHKYPDNDAPRKAIEAAQKYLKSEITLEELKVFRKNAYAAAAAAADAAYADAADAAYAAAAYAAADTAAAADVYTDTADADAYEYKDKLLSFFKEFVR